MTGAQLSRRAHAQPVEGYASVLLRSTSGILDTIEGGNRFPRDGTDGEWKIAGRDAILTMKDGVLKLATAAGDETFPVNDPRVIRRILAHLGLVCSGQSPGPAPPASGAAP